MYQTVFSPTLSHLDVLAFKNKIYLESQRLQMYVCMYLSPPPAFPPLFLLCFFPLSLLPSLPSSLYSHAKRLYPRDVALAAQVSLGSLLYKAKDLTHLYCTFYKWMLNQVFCSDSSFLLPLVLRIQTTSLWHAMGSLLHAKYVKTRSSLPPLPSSDRNI